MGIVFFNQFQFPGTPPAFNRFLSRDRVADVSIFFSMNKHSDGMRSCETTGFAGFMLRHPADKVVCDAGIEGAVPLVR